MITHKVVSADDHLDMSTLPPSLWMTRIPKKWRHRAPKVEEDSTGNWWIADGDKIYYSGVPKDHVIQNAISRAGITNDGFRPSNPKLRLQDMDLDGIQSQIIYGPPSGLKIADPDLKEACINVYNDWVCEFNAVAPGRLGALAYLPMHKADSSAAELRRIANMGIPGAVVSLFEAETPIYDRSWDALWQAAHDTELPISFHLAGGTHTVKMAPSSWKLEAFASVAPIQLDEALAVMIFSGALERYPNMQLVLGESGIGWLPYMLERMDFEYSNHGPAVKDYLIQTEPSQIFANQVFATFQEDNFGIQVIDSIGADRVMWASDYPHPDSTFPNSRIAIRKIFAGHEEDLIQQITCSNAARLYRIEGIETTH